MNTIIKPVRFRQTHADWSYGSSGRESAEIWRILGNCKPRIQSQFFTPGKHIGERSNVLDGDPFGTTFTANDSEGFGLTEVKNHRYLMFFGWQGYFCSDEDARSILENEGFSPCYKATCGANIHDNVTLGKNRFHKRQIMFAIDLHENDEGGHNLVSMRGKPTNNDFIKSIKFENGHLKSVTLTQPLVLTCKSELERRLIWNGLFKKGSADATLAKLTLEKVERSIFIEAINGNATILDNYEDNFERKLKEAIKELTNSINIAVSK